jgi:hypothetical protein
MFLLGTTTTKAFWQNFSDFVFGKRYCTKKEKKKEKKMYFCLRGIKGVHVFMRD